MSRLGSEGQRVEIQELRAEDKEIKVTVKVRITVKPDAQIKVTELAVWPLKACAMSPTCVIKISGSTPYLPHIRARTGARTRARTRTRTRTRKRARARTRTRTRACTYGPISSYSALFAFRCVQE